MNSCGRIVGVLSLCAAILALPTAAGAQQEKADEATTRQQRLEQIEAAIGRLEKRLPKLMNEGVGEAIVEELEKAVDPIQLRQLQLQPRYVVGVTLEIETNATDDEAGETTSIRVGSIIEDSPAAKAGLQAGDMITAVAGKAIESSEQLIDAIQATKGEEAISLTIVRGDETIDVELTPTLQKPQEQMLRFGLEGDQPFLRPEANQQLLQFIPQVQGFAGPQMTEMKQQLDAMQADMDEMKKHLSELTEQIKLLREALKD